DSACPALPQQWQKCLAHAPWAQQICCDRLGYRAIDIRLLGRLPGVIVNAGVVDEYIEVAVPLLHLICGVLDALWVGNIQEKRFYCAGLCELPRCRSCLSGFARGRKDDKPSARQLTAHFKSNAAVCDGDYCNACASVRDFLDLRLTPTRRRTTYQYPGIP